MHKNLDVGVLLSELMDMFGAKHLMDAAMPLPQDDSAAIEGCFAVAAIGSVVSEEAHRGFHVEDGINDASKHHRIVGLHIDDAVANGSYDITGAGQEGGKFLHIGFVPTEKSTAMGQDDQGAVGFRVSLRLIDIHEQFQLYPSLGGRRPIPNIGRHIRLLNDQAIVTGSSQRLLGNIGIVLVTGDEQERKQAGKQYGLQVFHFSFLHGLRMGNEIPYGGRMIFRIICLFWGMDLSKIKPIYLILVVVIGFVIWKLPEAMEHSQANEQSEKELGNYLEEKEKELSPEDIDEINSFQRTLGSIFSRLDDVSSTECQINSGHSQARILDWNLLWYVFEVDPAIKSKDLFFEKVSTLNSQNPFPGLNHRED